MPEVNSLSTKNTLNSTSIKCQYLYSSCVNNRAQKKNGSLHRFCELHRGRACQNQRRLVARKRQQDRISSMSNETQKRHRAKKRKVLPCLISHERLITRTSTIQSPTSTDSDLRMFTDTIQRNSFSLYKPNTMYLISKKDDNTTIQSNINFEGVCMEPYAYPVELQIEDLYCLYTTVLGFEKLPTFLTQ